MKALLLKDLLAQKPNLILGAMYSLIFFVAFGLIGDAPDAGFIYVFSGVAVGYTVLLGSFKLDVNDTPRFMFSLPISRSTGVNEKYMLLLLGTAYGTLWAVIFGALFKIPAIGWSTAFISGVDLLRIAAGMMILSFIVPLYFRVGHTIIRYLLIIGMGLLVVGQVVGMLVLSFRDGPGGPAPFLDFIFGWMSGEGSLSRTLVIAGIGVGAVVLSYASSQLVWRRREI